MDQAQQAHFGSGDNVGRDKIHITNNYPNTPFTPRSKYLNAFAHYELANLVGRETQLQATADHLEQHKLLLLHGIGGIGKTTLAKAYISKAHEHYEHIAYVEVVGSIAESMLSQLGNSPDVGLKLDPSLDLEVKFDTLIETLRHIPKLLLVLDNTNDVEELRGCKKQLASLNATVLITGRARPHSFIQEGNVQEVEALTPEEALRLFRRHYTPVLSESERELVEHMLKEAFYHPKLIEVLAKSAYQANAFLSLEEVSQIVSRKDYEDEEINYPIEIDDQTKKIYRVLLDLFDTTMLPEEAQQMLRYFAILPTIDIPVQDLATLLDMESTAARQALMGTLSGLVGSGWLEEVNNRFFSMHGLVQWVVRQRLLPTALNCHDLIEGMAWVLSYEPTDAPLIKQRYLPYTTEWLKLFAHDLDIQLAGTFTWIATTYRHLGNDQQALVYDQQALIIRQDMLPPSHPNLALSYSNLASTYGRLGDHQQRLVYNLQALSIRKAILPPDHPDLVTSYNNMGETYNALGDYKQAFVYNQLVKAIWEAVLPADHPNLASAYLNLAATYRHLSEYQQALHYNQQAIAIWEAKLSMNHPSLATAYHGIASVYELLKDYQQALSYYQKGLIIRKNVLPATHPDLARSYNRLGITHYHLGEWEKSYEYFQKSVIIWEQIFLLYPVELTDARNNLAGVAQRMQERNDITK